jgi:branched-chain amino acid transport system permease protein
MCLKNKINMNKIPKYRALPVFEGAVFALLLFVPLIADKFVISSLTVFLLLSMLAISFELCWGYTGILTFGQGFFFGIGGYVVAILMNKAQVINFYVLSAGAIGIGILLGLFFGAFLFLGKRVPTIIFIAIGTMTLSYLGERFFTGWAWVGAANGQTLWEVVEVFGVEFIPGVKAFYVVMFFLTIIYLLCRFVVRSQLGLVCSGLRQSEERLKFLGYQIQVPKLIIFTFAAAIASFAGGVFSLHEGFVGPTSLGFTFSAYAALYCLFGGSGTLIGAIIGTIAIEMARLYLSDINMIKHYWQIVLGAILIVVILFRPHGIVGLFVGTRERIGYFGFRGTRKLKVKADKYV